MGTSLTRLKRKRSLPDYAETNRFNTNTAEIMARLKTELATDTVNRCNAMGQDLFNQLKANTKLVTQSPDRMQVTLKGLLSIHELLVSDCPAELQIRSASSKTASTDYRKQRRCGPLAKTVARRSAHRSMIYGLSSKTPLMIQPWSVKKDSTPPSRVSEETAHLIQTGPKTWKRIFARPKPILLTARLLPETLAKSPCQTSIHVSTLSMSAAANSRQVVTVSSHSIMPTSRISVPSKPRSTAPAASFPRQ